MKLAIFTPFGFLHRESGLLYLVANYLRKSGADVQQLRCDGALSVCGRDKRVPGGRSLFSCARCAGEQRRLADWAEARAAQLSSFATSEDKLQSAKWIASVKADDLQKAEFRGVNLFDVCRGEFLEQTGGASAAGLSSADEQALRLLYVAYVQGVVASERFLTQWAPSLTFMAGGDDSISSAYRLQVAAQGIDAALFTYDSVAEAITVESLRSGECYSSKLILDGITSMRSDPRTWAPEVRAVVHEIMSFLGYAADRIS
jgi:hypothetical protein